MAEGKLPKLSYIRCMYLVAVYFLVYLYVLPYVFAKLTLWINPYATTVLLPLQYIAYTLTFLLVFLCARPILIHGIDVLQKNWRACLKVILTHVVILLILNITLSLLVALFTGTQTSNNQNGIVQSSYTQPILNLVVTVGFAPFVEECVFRGGIFLKIRQYQSFFVSAILSSFCFGFIHVFSSIISGNFIDTAYLAVYAGIGFLLAYTFEKSGTIYACMVVHAICNLISLLVIYLG